MLISKIGEFGLIERFRKSIKTDSTVVKGSGDDCAVLKLDKYRYMLATCDMMVEGVDFTRRDSPYLIGRKALAISISDIAACAGLPRYALVSLGLPKNSPLKLADEIFKGITGLAKRYKINIIGGDLSRSDKITIDISLFGIVEKKNLILRSKARKKDIIFVTGSLGGSILGKHLTFQPRIKEARLLAEKFKPNAMIDISDGLVQDLSHILKSSKVGAVIYESLIPIDKKAKGLNDALFSGEDFELLFTVSLNNAKKILNLGLDIFKPIGEIVDGKYGLRLIDKTSKERIVKLKGFKHF